MVPFINASRDLSFWLCRLDSPTKESIFSSRGLARFFLIFFSELLAHPPPPLFLPLPSIYTYIQGQTGEPGHRLLSPVTSVQFHSRWQDEMQQVIRSDFFVPFEIGNLIPLNFQWDAQKRFFFLTLHVPCKHKRRDGPVLITMETLMISDWGALLVADKKGGNGPKDVNCQHPGTESL